MARIGVPRRIADELRRALDAGQYPVDTPMPSAKDLCARFGVAPPVVSDAFNILAREGRITRGRKGARRYVLTGAGVADPGVKSVMLTLRVESALHAGLEAVALARGVSVSQVVRDAVLEHLERGKRDPGFQARLREQIAGLERLLVPEAGISPSPSDP